jgi:hypothetical protein
MREGLLNDKARARELRDAWHEARIVRTVCAQRVDSDEQQVGWLGSVAAAGKEQQTAEKKRA